ncbi:MAG: hypothetical protein ABJM26_09870 [Anderseniella sp.]
MIRISQTASGMALAACLAVAPLTQAQAADFELPDTLAQFPNVSGSFVLELQSDTTFDSDDPGAEITDTFATVETSLDFNLSEIFTVHTDLVLEPVLDPDPFGNRFFEDHGGYVETLHLIANLGQFTLFGGKINPAFGTAWDATPGIYGTDFAEDYELTERIGVGGSYTFGGGDAGQHVLQTAVFFADTSGLSNSVFTRRGQLSVADGGASNTEEFSSFAIALDGGEIASLPGFSYHVSFRHQEAGDGDVSDETGFAIGAKQEIETAGGMKFELNGEVAVFDNLDGGENDALYATAGLAVGKDEWFGATSFTLRDLSGGPAGTNFDDKLFQATVGREVFENASLAVGYKFAEEEEVESHTIGVLFAYETDFSTNQPQ